MSATAWPSETPYLSGRIGRCDSCGLVGPLLEEEDLDGQNCRNSLACDYRQAIKIRHRFPGAKWAWRHTAGGHA